VLHLEPFLDTVIAHLQMNLPGRIDAQNAVNDFDIDPIPSEHYFLGGSDPVVYYPSVEVAIPDWQMGRYALDQQIAELRMQLMIRVFARTPLGPEHLYRTLLRYGVCVNEVMIDPQGYSVLGQRGVLEGARGFYRFNPEAQELEPLTGGSLYVYTIQAEEVRP
jgi:hypothetical protein